MTALLVPKDRIAALLAALLEKYQVIAPVEEDGRIAFARLRSPEEAVLDYRNAQVSAKGLLFPQSEALLAYDLTGNKKYLDTCKAWSDEMVDYQSRMTPANAYYMAYAERVGPGATYRRSKLR